MNELIASTMPARAGLIATLLAGDEKSPSEAFEKDRKKNGGEMSDDEEVDEGLEESFPASDPVSPTRTDKPAGASD